AQIAGGVKADDELVELMTKTNGIYDYAHRENSFLGTWRQIAEEAIGAEYASTVDEVVNEVFEKEYKQCIASAVEAIAKLSENGYSTAKIIGLLLHEPLRRWPKLVTDLLASQKSHQLEHAS